MHDDQSEENRRPFDTGKALRHVLIFQLKLAADALRDLLLSPWSLVAFAVDAFNKPTLDQSHYYRLMRMGRRSDRLINLFDEHGDSDDYTIDHAVDDIETMLRKKEKEAPADWQDATADASYREGSQAKASQEGRGEAAAGGGSEKTHGAREL